MPPEQVQSYLIEAFKQWGMPKSIRVDNGMPLGDPQRKSIPILALWIEAMGVQVIFNRPRRPTDNAKVERMQRTTKNWAEVEQCQNYGQLKSYLMSACMIQREHFKVTRLGGKTRKDYFPELYTNTNNYHYTLFEPKKAYQRLSKWTFARKTSKIGQFSLYGQTYYLGKVFAKQYVAIQFDPEHQQWKVKDSNGDPIKAFHAINFDHANLWNLTLCQRTPKKAQT